LAATWVRRPRRFDVVLACRLLGGSNGSSSVAVMRVVRSRTANIGGATGATATIAPEEGVSIFFAQANVIQAISPRWASALQRAFRAMCCCNLLPS
jgi:hypothetical protein